MAALLTWDALVSFLSLTFLELVLSVDNILFISLAAARLPRERRGLGRQLGLWLALGLRVAMLSGIVWLTRINTVLFSAFRQPITVKDLVLIAGGLFLIYKGATEIHDSFDDLGPADDGAPVRPRASLPGVVLQIA